MNDILNDGIKIGAEFQKATCLLAIQKIIDKTQTSGFWFFRKKALYNTLLTTIKEVLECELPPDISVTKYSQTLERWANIYPDGAIRVHRNKDDALKLAGEAEHVRKGIKIIITEIPEPETL